MKDPVSDISLYGPEEAINRLLEHLCPIKETESVSLRDSIGRVASDDIYSDMDVPPFSRSAMDGYAVRSVDVVNATVSDPVRLRVAGKIFAGDSVDPDQGPDDIAGTAYRIMTGGRIPVVYDAVIRQEDTDSGDEVVTIFRSAHPYENYCMTGEDIPKGSLVIRKGTMIGRAEAGVLASLGIAYINVLRKVIINVISTGSEITDVGEPLNGSSIYNSISYGILASLYLPAFDASAMTVPDDKLMISEAIQNVISRSDIVITTGGVSVGQKDLLPSVLDDIGAVKIFSGLRIKPGSPTIGSILDNRPILSLSGNPYAAIVNLDLYLWKMISRITLCERFIPEVNHAILSSDIPKNNIIRRFIRAFVRDGQVFIEDKGHASSVLSSYLRSNCYVDLPQGHNLQKGDKVRIIMMPEAVL